MLKRMRSAADEVVAPKYAHLERERRWLVDPPSLNVTSLEDPIAIHDRYILGTRLRLRSMHCAGQSVWKLTRKYECDNPLARPIVTAYLIEEEYRALTTLPALDLRKTRHKASEGGHDFSVDSFEGRLEGLWLAEIELEDAELLAILPNPSWSLADVSHDPRYQGFTLAQCGIPKD
ncbi:MAG: hypothetical protein WC692_09050 [Erythrobacter sp.]